MKAKSAAWAKHLQRQSSSGFTIAKYCERYRLSPGMFYYWKRKISIAAPAEPVSFRELEMLPERSGIPVFIIEFDSKAIIRIEGPVSPSFLLELIGC